MKALLLIISMTLLSLSAQAADTICQAKIKNAASYEVAQELGVPVQGVEVVSTGPLRMTRMAANNSILGNVTVRVGNRIDRGMTVVEYTVGAQQIGSGRDCNVSNVRELEDQ